MDYLIIFLLSIRVFICENVCTTSGIYFDISFCLCFALYVLLGKGRVLNRKFFIYPLVFIGLLLLNTIFSINPYNSQNEVLKSCMYMLVFVFVCLLDRGKRRLLIVSLLVASIIISLRAVYQYFSGLEYINQHYAYEQIINKGFYAIEMLKQKRVISWFLSPNLLAGYLLIIVPVALGSAINSYKQKQIKQLIFFGAIFILAAISLYLTRSWGAYLGFSIAMVLIIFKILKSSQGFKINLSNNVKWLSGVVFLLLIFTAMHSNRGEYFFDINNPQNSLVQRLYYWQSSEEIIKANPFTGVGLGNFGIIYPQFKNINANETIYAHNLFLQLWAELGTILFLFLTGFIIYFYLNVLKKIKHEQSAVLGFNAAIIAFLVYNFFDFSFFVFQSGYVFFIIVACLAVPQQNEKEGISFNSKNFLNKIIFILICSPMILFLSQEYNSQIALDKASLFLKQGKVDAAINQGYRSLKYRANNDQIYHFLAVCAIKKNPNIFSLQAIRFYQKAIELNPNYAFYYYYMAEYFQAHKLYSQAEQAREKALEHYPHNKKFKEMYEQIQGQ